MKQKKERKEKKEDSSEAVERQQSSKCMTERSQKGSRLFKDSLKFIKIH